MPITDEEKVQGRIHGDQFEPKEKDSLLMRLLFMVLIALMISLAQSILTVATVLQYIIMLVNKGAANERLGDFGTDLRKLLDQFMDRQNVQPITYQSGQAALHSPGIINETRIGDLRILRVGDAAGQVKNSTVGGSVTGFFGGKAAAEAILSDIPYRRSLRTGKREMDLHFYIRKLLGNMNQVDYQHLVRYLNPAVLSFLSLNDRDSMRRKFRLLPILQPRFIPLGIKLVLKWILSK